MDTKFGKGDRQTAKTKVFDRINVLGIRPNEELGQHFLIDDKAISLLAQAVTPGNTVVEVGAGVGQLTEALAQKAGKVIAIEIDRRYETVLDEVARKNPNVQIIYGDALATKFRDFLKSKKKNPRDDTEVQIVASLPYHITEPFLHKLIELPLESVTLVIGQRLARAIQTRYEDDPEFGQLTLLTQTFFDIEVLARVEKQKFFPIPRTDSIIIRLVPKEKNDLITNKRDFLLRRLFLTSKDSPLIKNSLREEFIEFDNHRSASAQLTKNQAREIIDRMELPEEILDKPFDQLNNNDLKILSRALREEGE